jgi:hypothetical protein
MMLTNYRQFAFIGAVSLLMLAALFTSTSRPIVAAEELPKQLSDSAFWTLATEFSEPGGYFRSDNFVSNEDNFQFVIPELKTTTKSAGVYLGVGPDQNFTYIVALQPKIAFIFDIRRQNMMQHLMYKALIELSADRVEFISKLFSRRRPQTLKASATPQELFAAYADAVADPKLFDANWQAILERLKKHHGFTLSATDEQSMHTVYRAFFDAGPQITYSFSRFGGGRGRMPSYEELMMTDDGEGVNRTYMGNEQNFHALKTMQANNLIVPLVGDFAGEKAIRAVARYLKQHQAMVTAFYLSNVEQYLFQDPDNWKRFYTNVGELPLDSRSTFIRSYFSGNGMGYFNGGYSFMRSQNLLCSMEETLKAFRAGKISSYADVIRMSFK